MLDQTAPLPRCGAQALQCAAAADHAAAQAHVRTARRFAGTSHARRPARLLRTAMREEARARDLLAEVQ